MTTIDLLPFAIEAWKMMNQDEDPMPAWAAVDWVRGDRTDDVQSVKAALYEAAVMPLEKTYRLVKDLSRFDITIPEILHYFKNGMFIEVVRVVNRFLDVSGPDAPIERKQWCELIWCELMKQTVNVCAPIASV